MALLRAADEACGEHGQQGTQRRIFHFTLILVLLRENAIRVKNRYIRTKIAVMDVLSFRDYCLSPHRRRPSTRPLVYKDRRQDVRLSRDMEALEDRREVRPTRPLRCASGMRR